MGVPSVFLRLFGCNFRCKNFGRYGEDALDTTVTHNPEVEQVIKQIHLYKSYTDLPLVSTGCDSYAAVYPEFKHLSPTFKSDQLAQEIVSTLPFKEWRDEHLVITGGEPLLAGWQKALPALLEDLAMSGLKEITFETNGTQPLSDSFKQYLHQWTAGSWDREITFSVSAKLSCSGETRESAIQPDAVCSYQSVGNTYLKFVVATEADVEESLQAVNTYKEHGFTGHTYLMPVGGVESVYNLNNRRVAELAMKHGLRYSDRLQLPLFANQWGT